MANFLTTDGLQRIRNHQRDPEIQEINFSTGTFFQIVFNEFWWMPLSYFKLLILPFEIFNNIYERKIMKALIFIFVFINGKL